MLDVEAWIDEEKDGKIMYSHFEKSTKSNFVMSKNSAMANSKKFEILSQGIFRRLHNTSEDLHENVSIEILNKFMIQLKIGYQ